MSETQHRDDSECGEAALYALGLLSEEHAKRFLAHAQRCVVCRDEIASLEPVIDALPQTAPAMSAPRSLRGKVMSEVRREATLSASMRAAKARRASPVRRVALAGGAAALISIGIAIGSALSSPSSAKRHISVRVAFAGASATLEREGSQAAIVYSHLPPPGAGRVYEVWVERSEGGPPQPTSALFRPGAGGGGRVKVPGGLQGVVAVMVTSELRGGSLVPTRSPIIVARLS